MKPEIYGKGEWASISYCPPITTIYLFKTEEEARQAKKNIDECGCGGRCINFHRVEKRNKK